MHRKTEQALSPFVRLWLTLALIGGALVPAVTARAAPNGTHTFTIMLAGIHEVPGPGDPDGSGHAQLTLNAQSGEVCYAITVDAVAPLTAGHIHQAAETASGPVVVNLLTDPTQLTNCVSADPTLVQAIVDAPADYYVNLHNGDFPAGALRGQLQSHATLFTVRIENISGGTHFPGPFSPGVWAVFGDGAAPLFDADQPDRGDGLAAIAEDGNPMPLAETLRTQDGVHFSGAFTTPTGGSGPAPLLPGEAYEFKIKATSPADRFTLASMLVQSNDIFIGPGPNGIALFDADGNPIHGDITMYNPFWDVGSEVNEAPGMGPNQAPRQPSANSGAAEGVVAAFTNSTRAMPLADGIIAVELTEENGEFTFVITNISANGGSIITPLSPPVYVTHNEDAALFQIGEPASAGIEAVAEDGNAPVLVNALTGAPGVGMVNAAGAPVGPGGQFSFSVTPSVEYPYLSLATMVVESNDAFLAFGPEGLKLVDDNGAPREVDAILADFHREMVIWDAGTEANEVPGVGPNQVLRQSAPNSGPVDPIPGVHLYRDSTNDLAGPNAGGFGEIHVTNSGTPGHFDVTLVNTSGNTVYPGALTPVAWAIHNGETQLFDAGMPASMGLERLAEDGNPAVLAGELAANVNVHASDVTSVPDGATDPGPLFPGDSYSWQIEADGSHRYFSVASMIVPSNDTFFAFEPAGLRLMNEDGTPRSDEEIAADIANQRLAWDAGTERNQAGAAGPDQAPRQAGPDTGMNEGAGIVSLLDGSDGVWRYPHPEEVVRITIEPMMMPPAPTWVYLSGEYWGWAGDVALTDEDIVAYDPAAEQWVKVFDASDVGLMWNDLNAHAIVDDGILMSFKVPRIIDGLGWVDDSDIVKFAPTSLGEQTAGSFTLWFDGSDVGLTRNSEDIDAITFTPDGYLLVSTSGRVIVDGVAGRDEDLLLFHATSYGDETAGTWQRYFDGSDVSLGSGQPEDLWGAWVDPSNGELYLTTRGKFQVRGLRGDGDDIFICTPSSLGAQTDCEFSRFWNGAAAGFHAGSIDALWIGPPVALNSVTSSAVDANDALDSDMAEEEAIEGDDDLSAEDHAADDLSDGAATELRIFVPLIAGE